MVTPVKTSAGVLTGGDASVSSDENRRWVMVAYRMVTGTAPYPTEKPMAGAILRAKHPIPRPRTLLPSLDPRWDLAIARALERKPSARFADPADFVTALRGSTAPIALANIRNDANAAAACAAACVVLAGAGFASWRIWTGAPAPPAPEVRALFQKGVDDIHDGAYFAATRALREAVQESARNYLFGARPPSQRARWLICRSAPKMK